MNPLKQYSIPVWHLTAGLCLFTMMGVSSCMPSARGSIVDGEWAISLVIADQATEHPLAGVIVFNRTIPAYNPQASTWSSTPRTVGRYYVEVYETQVAQQTDTITGAVFFQDPDADLFEEVYATVRGDTLILEVAPNVTDYSYVFSGRIAKDTVVGVWRSSAYGSATLSGTFQMTRKPSSTAADSARLRARAGVARWTRT